LQDYGEKWRDIKVGQKLSAHNCYPLSEKRRTSTSMLHSYLYQSCTGAVRILLINHSFRRPKRGIKVGGTQCPQFIPLSERRRTHSFRRPSSDAVTHSPHHHHHLACQGTEEKNLMRRRQKTKDKKSVDLILSSRLTPKTFKNEDFKASHSIIPHQSTIWRSFSAQKFLQHQQTTTK
jgi:hypothetical protein